MSKVRDTNTWKSKWVKTSSDQSHEYLIICNECGFNLGILDKDITKNKFPKQCQCCKRDMENGVV